MRTPVALAVVVALVACSNAKDSGKKEPPPTPVAKKVVPQAPLPPLAADPGGATGKPTWALGLGGIGTTAPRAVATDADGATYVCGYFDGAVDFGGDAPKLGKRTATGGSDAFVAKIDPKGKLVWVQTFGSARDDTANGIVVRGESVVVVGNFTDQLKLVAWDGKSDWDHKANGSDDAFVAAFDRDGNPKWLWTLGGIDSDGMNAIAAAPDGGWVIGGSFSGIVKVEQLGVTLKTKGGTDAVLAKLAATGDLEWVKQFGGHYNDAVSHLAIDPRGNIYVQGLFHDVAEWGGKQLKAGGGSDADVVLAKYDLNGDHLWSHRFGNAFNEVAGGVAVDPSGHVTMTGSFEQKGPISFGEGDSHTSNGESDVFIVRFTPDGKLEWARTFGAAREDVGWGIAADAAGNTVTTGWFQRTVDFGKGAVTSAGEKDVFVVKLDATGAIVWARTWGDHDSDRGYAIALDASGGAIVGGIFRFKLVAGDLAAIESVRDDKNPALSKAPKANAFVVRLDR